VIDEHESAARVECLKYGRSVDDIGPAFSWADFIAIAEQSRPGDPLYMSMHPDDGAWNHESMLLASAVDALHILAWQNAGGKKKDKPKPIPRPGVADKNTERVGGKTSVPLDKLRAWLDRRNGPRKPVPVAPEAGE